MHVAYTNQLMQKRFNFIANALELQNLCISSLVHWYVVENA